MKFIFECARVHSRIHTHTLHWNTRKQHDVTESIRIILINTVNKDTSHYTETGSKHKHSHACEMITHTQTHTHTHTQSIG